MECSTHAYGIIRVNFFSLFISFIVFFFFGFRRFASIGIIVEWLNVIAPVVMSFIPFCFRQRGPMQKNARIYTNSCGHIQFIDLNGLFWIEMNGMVIKMAHSLPSTPLFM